MYNYSIEVMTDVKKLAKSLKVKSALIIRTITKMGIICEHRNGKRILIISPEQQNLIIDTLIFERKVTEIILPSKLNHVESKEEQYEQFREFKKKTYGKAI